MVYKKYVYKRGRRHGPYYYHSYRDGDNIRKVYIGGKEEYDAWLKKGEQKKEKSRTTFQIPSAIKNKQFLVIPIVILLIIAGFIIYNYQITGKASLDIQSSYVDGENISGVLRLGLKKGELLPINTKILVEQPSKTSEFALNQFVNANSEGNFFIENTELSGNGLGYGFSGEEITYPLVFFKLKITNLGIIEEPIEPSEEPTEEPSEPAEEPIEEDPSEEIIEEPSESTEAIPSEESSSSEPSSSESGESSSESSGSSEESGSLITGGVISEAGEEVEIKGSVSYGNPFSYNLEAGQTAETVEGSLEIETFDENGNIKREKISESSVTLQISDGKAEVTTDYSISRGGFGEEFLKDEEETFEINLEEFGIVAEEGELKISLIYEDKTLVGVTKNINVEPPLAGNVTEEIPEIIENITNVSMPETNLTNETIINETITNETLENITILTIQEPARIGEPVKWKKQVSLENPEDVKVNLPKEAENIAVKKLTKEENEEKLEEDITLKASITGQISADLELKKEQGILSRIWNTIKNGVRRITGLAVSEEKDEKEEIEVLLQENATEYTIEYETEAPQAVEEDTTNGKRIIVSGPETLHYENVLAFTNIREAKFVKLYHIINESREEINFTAYDNNQNGLIDYIEWQVESLSNQTYEIIYITKAEHLDENRTLIEDVYPAVSEKDGNWTEIPDGDYLRVTFEQNLTNKRDITLYARSKNESSPAEIEVYTEGSEVVIAQFENIMEENWHKVYLTNLPESESYETFDLRSLGDVEYDYVVDPDDEYPQFSTYQDNNGTLTGTGTGEFNITMTSTNTTVLLEINGVNVTAGSETTAETLLTASSTDNPAYYGNLTETTLGVAATAAMGAAGYTLLATKNDLSFDGAVHTNALDTFVYVNFTVPPFSTNIEIIGWINMSGTTSMGLALYNGTDWESINSTGNSATNTKLDYILTDASKYISAGVMPVMAWESSSNDRIFWVDFIGLNITSSNGVYNATYDFASGGVYDYLWHSWGNGTSINYNQSNTQSYTIASDTTRPNIAIESPTAMNYTSSSLEFNISANENFGSCLFSLDSYASNTTMSINATETGANYTNESVPDGSYTVNFWCNDTVGNVNDSESVAFRIDTVAPKIAIESPTAMNYTSSSLEFNLSSDQNLGTCFLTLDSYASNTTMSINATETGANYTNESVPDGSYTVNFWCNDTVGNVNDSESVAFRIDTIQPWIKIEYPENNTNISNNAVEVNYTVGDEVGIETCWYNNDSFGSNETLASCVNITTVTWGEGEHNVTIWVNDSAGNENSTDITFTIDTIFPTIDYGDGTQNDYANTSNALKWIYVNVSANDANEFNITFLLWNYTSEVNETTYETAVREINWTDLTDINYTYNVTICDIANNCNYTPTYTLTINTLPLTTIPVITPDPPAKSDNLVCGFTVSDDNDEQDLYFNYTWYRTNSTDTNYTHLTGNESTNAGASTTTLDSGNTTFGDIWICEIEPADEIDNGITKNSSQVQVPDITPDIEIVFPSNNINTSDTGIEINFTTNDANLEDCWYNNDSFEGVNTSLGTGGDCTNITGVTWSAGEHNVTIWVNDSSNDVNSSSVTFFIDTTAPTVTLIEPVNNTLNNTDNTINFYYNVTEAELNITNCSLIIGYEVNITDVSVLTDTTNNITIYLPNREYEWSINCTDEANNIGGGEDRNISVNFDNTPPDITAESPVNGTTYTVTTIDFNVSLSEAGSWCGFSLDDSENITMTEINTTYFNFTNDSMTDGIEHNVTFVCNDTAGNMNDTMDMVYFSTVANTAPTNATVSINSTDLGNKTKEDLNCYAVIEDPDAGNTLNATVEWYNESSLLFTLDYNESYANGSLLISTLDSANTTKGENWSCGVRLYDSSAYSDWANSSAITILNTVPAVNLTAPENANETTNRTPEFSWTGDDDDSDSLTYEINISGYYSGGGRRSACDDYQDKAAIGSDTSYIPSEYIRCLVDNGYYLNWTVRAYDTEEYGSWTAERNITINSEITVSLPVSEINFGSMNLSEYKDTTGDDPEAIVLQNDGNAEINVSINFTALWDSAAFPSDKFRYKLREPSGECYEDAGTQTAWLNAPPTTTESVNKLNFTSGYQTGCNNASLDINITVPSDEPAGNKSSIVTFTASLSEEGFGAD